MMIRQERSVRKLSVMERPSGSQKLCCISITSAAGRSPIQMGWPFAAPKQPRALIILVDGLRLLHPPLAVHEEFFR
jgi:hypothetical protein